MHDRPTILISDDEPLVAKAIQREAKRFGIDTIVDTTSAVHELAREHQPDLIILDLRQQLDGRDLLADLKKDPETAHLKVIILSGVEDQFTRTTCLELGADDYEVKPFDPAFIRKVARLTGKNPDPAPGEGPELDITVEEPHLLH